MREVMADMVMEESPTYEHQSNGRVERAIQRLQGQYRSLKDGLETRYRMKVTEDHMCLPWLMRYSAALMNRFEVGSDGRTPYERWKGKTFRRKMAEFGEVVLYLMPGTVGVNKHACRWDVGVWLGVRDESGEILIGTSKGVIKANVFRRRGSEAERWDVEVFNLSLIHI